MELGIAGKRALVCAASKGLGKGCAVALAREGVEITAALTEIADRISKDDPYIKAVRIGRYKPGVVRLVLDLKTEVKPQAFVLPPVGEYGHRLVLDLYPLVPPDPLLAFLESRRAPESDPGVEPATRSSEPASIEAAPPRRAVFRWRRRPAPHLAPRRRREKARQADAGRPSHSGRNRRSRSSLLCSQCRGSQ